MFWIGFIFPEPIYSFSIAARTEVNKFSGFRQYKFIFCFWRSEAWHWSHWANIKVWAGLCCFLDALGEDLFSYSFGLLAKFSLLWLWLWEPISFLAINWEPFSASKGNPFSLARGHHSFISIPSNSRMSSFCSWNCSSSCWKGPQLLRTRVIRLGPPDNPG